MSTVSERIAEGNLLQIPEKTSTEAVVDKATVVRYRDIVRLQYVANDSGALEIVRHSANKTGQKPLG